MAEEGLNLENQNLKHEGFVCFIGDDFVMLQDPVRQVVRLPKSIFQDEIVLGEFYWPSVSEYHWEKDPVDEEPKVYVENGVVHAKVLAFAPIPSHLSYDLRKKYKNTAWSSSLQLLADPNNLFLHFPYSEVGMATVKYAPNEERRTAFEVIAVDEVPVEQAAKGFDGFLAAAPWLIEGKAPLMQIYGDPPEKSPRFSQTKKINKSRVFNGICLSMRSENRRGNKPCEVDVEWIYSAPLGFVRSLGRGIGIGNWISFHMVDKRHKKKFSVGTNHMNGAKLKFIEVLRPALPTKVIETPGCADCVEMSVSFIFDYDMFESAENRTRENWAKRCKGFKEDVEFADLVLGRISITPWHIPEIIKHIESEEVREEYPDLLMPRENDTIAVEVHVRPIPNFIKRYKNDVAAAMFATHSVGRISYLIGGKQIKPQLIEDYSDY